MNQSLAEAQQGLNYTIEAAKELAMERQATDPDRREREDLERLLMQNEETMTKLQQGIENMQVAFEMAVGKAEKQTRQKPDRELADRMDALAGSMDKMSDAVNMLHTNLAFQENRLRGAEQGGGQRA